MNYYSKQINDKLDIFFDKKSERYGDMKIFTEIFDFMDNSDFKEKEPEIFIAEVKRIRDIHNSFMYALEEGYKKRMTAYKKEIVDDMIKDGFDFSVIGEIIGGTDDDINKLKE